MHEKIKKPTLDNTIKELVKKYKDDNIIQDLSKDNSSNIKTVSTGLPSLDYIMGGGVPVGRIMEVYGPEASGKTTMALQMLAKCQRDGSKVAFIDAENAFDPEYAKKMGVDIKNLLFNQPSSGEEALDIVEKLAQTGEVSIIVVDSVAALLPQSNLAKEIDGTANIGTVARLMSQNLPRLANACSRNNVTLIFINQIRMKIGVMWGNPETTGGGLALKFYSSVRVEIRSRKPEERYGKEGCPVGVTIKKNKINKPFLKTELFLIFGEGFDQLGDLAETALQLGAIIKKGGWYEYEGLQVQGWSSFLDSLSQDEKLLGKLTKQVNASK